MRRIQVVACLSLIFCSTAAFSQDGALSCTNYITVIAENGLVVDELNPDERRAPASMVKLMLILMVAEGLDQGLWTLETPINVSLNAQGMGGTQVQVKAGDVFTLEAMMRAVCVASANDAAYAIAEELWGSEANYLLAANARAKELGMKDTTVRSVHGLPPSDGELPDETTARDLAILSCACVSHPQIMTWVGMKELVFRPGESPKANTNKLLLRTAGCDGLKTGYTRAAGFCLTATAVRNDVRLITVVMGCPRLKDRFDVASKLMEDGFSKVRRVRLLAADTLVDPAITVRNAKQTTLRLAPDHDVWITAKETDFPQMTFETTTPKLLQAPLTEGQHAGSVKVKLAGQVLGETPLRVPMAIEEPSLLWKLTHRVQEKAEEIQPAIGG
ncbi:MAG: D-alanyl-D-alanine carboxypeptidase [Candidatus Hydrogenedentes bacterium]|nr:D-alanyl-D-alanine carboxypeptidase [Candidatus Hydrogenedentota bacterium]